MHDHNASDDTVLRWLKSASNHESLFIAGMNLELMEFQCETCGHIPVCVDVAITVCQHKRLEWSNQVERPPCARSKSGVVGFWKEKLVVCDEQV